ncbi:MAG: DUF4382 domain-containing protein [Candidatus Thermoplasmatota archaeon]
MNRTPTPKLAGLLAMTSLALVALAGCSSQSSDEGSLALYVKDAPLDQYDQLRVTITRAEALPDQASDWVTVYDGEKTVDLLALQSPTAKEKLAELGVPAGPYSGLRLAISEAVGIDANGTEYQLVVAGNVLTVLESFEIGKGADLSLLLDIDTNASASEPGLFAPQAKALRSSHADQDQDGVDDVEDADYNATESPRQERSNLYGLCTAWMASETAREHGNATDNSTAFARLGENATDAGQSLEDFCDAQPFPGKSDAIPEDAQEARQAAMERREQAGNGTAGRPTSTPSPSAHPTGAPENQTQSTSRSGTHGPP